MELPQSDPRNSASNAVNTISTASTGSGKLRHERAAQSLAGVHQRLIRTTFCRMGKCASALQDNSAAEKDHRVRTMLNINPMWSG